MAAMQKGDMVVEIGNRTVLCQNPHNLIRNAGSWRFFNSPIRSASSRLMLQLSAISIVSQLIDGILKPLGQSSIVSHILGGIILGPSLLGHKNAMSTRLFPPRGNLVLETFSTFGLMFYLFSIGVKMDPAIAIASGKKALTISLSLYLSALALPQALALMLHTVAPLQNSLLEVLPYIATSQSLSGFPVIAGLLTEHKILNTDIGRLALSISMFCDLVGLMTTSIGVTLIGGRKNGGMLPSFLSVFSLAAVGLAIMCLLRPLVLKVRERTRGKAVNEIYVFYMMFLVLGTGLVSEVVGQHYMFGPLLLGLVVPDGPPFGAALIDRMDTLASGLFYPTYLALSGLKTNVFKIRFEATWVIGLLVVFASIVKVGAVMLPARYYRMPVKDAFVLGLILNAKGIIELMVYNVWKDSKILSDEEFGLAVISVVTVAAIIAPMIKFLYDPSQQFYSITRSTIQHSRRDTEFRILICIHHHDSVPTLVNLLEVSHASEESHVAVIALILIELVGRTSPVLIPHPPKGPLQRSKSTTSQILNALRRYEDHNEGYATLHSFTSVSHYETMPEDIFRVALDNQATIIVLPFHKQWAIDGLVGSVNRSIQKINLKILETSPCSIGILIDRGILNRQISVMTIGTVYHVAVIFIGGADDAESLTYAARMAKHRSVDLTVVRFLLFGDENTNDRKRDSDLIDEYRQANVGNDHFVIVEEVIKDGVGLSSSIKKMVDCFDLMLVGKHHQENQILTGLNEWSECPELGVVGDMLASPDFNTTSSVLVVQQQRIGGKRVGWNLKQPSSDKEQSVHDHGNQSELSSRASWAITMDK